MCGPLSSLKPGMDRTSTVVLKPTHQSQAVTSTAAAAAATEAAAVPSDQPIPYIGLAIGLGTCLLLLALSIGAVFLLSLKRRGKRLSRWPDDSSSTKTSTRSNAPSGKPQLQSQKSGGAQDINVLPLMGNFQGIL